MTTPTRKISVGQRIQVQGHGPVYTVAWQNPDGRVRTQAGEVFPLALVTLAPAENIPATA